MSEETRQSKRILIVVSYAGKVIGGHRLSAISLAKYLSLNGHSVGLLTVEPPYRIPELDGAPFSLHYSPYPDQPLAVFFSRSRDILRVAREHQYETLVAMDWEAALHCGWAAFLAGLQLIQVIPGGKVGVYPPLRLPGILVFSEELYEGLPEKFGIPARDIVLSRGRIDFNYFEKIDRQEEGKSPVQIAAASSHVLTVSRLDRSKAPALIHTLEQVRHAARRNPVELLVVGVGDGLEQIKSRAQEIVSGSGSNVQIHFLGGFRVTPADLRMADLVIGQGRTVVEAMASGVPAAVCGNDGYMGLVRTQNLAELAVTNLTGRGLRSERDLAGDLEELKNQPGDEVEKVRRMAYELFDAHLGADGLECAIHLLDEQRIPAGSRRVRILKAYLQVLPPRIKRQFARMRDVSE